MSFGDRLDSVRARIATVCDATGRDPGAVELLAVSKARSVSDVRDAFTFGQTMFGENRVPELTAKATELAVLDLRWHMIGSVQTNKVSDLVAVPRLALLHSLDRRKLADRLQSALAEREATMGVLLQVNATDDPQKHGVAPGDAAALLDHVRADCPALTPQGLMAMGPLRGNPRPVFDAVAKLREQLRERTGLELPVLSLGMTADLGPAVAAGSTLVRVGTGVFGPR